MNQTRGTLWMGVFGAALCLAACIKDDVADATDRTPDAGTDAADDDDSDDTEDDDTDDDGDDPTDVDAGDDTSDGGDDSDADSDAGTDPSSGTEAEAADCAGTGPEKAVCAANLFLSALTTTQKTTANLAYDDFASRTKWSNLPGVTRAGIKLGALDASSKAAALSMMATVLSAAGNTDLTGVLAADDYLGSMSGSGGMSGMGGMGGGGYASTNYAVAVYGTPSVAGNWAISFGGHHMAFNVAWHAGVGYPTPHHIGAEPKTEFTLNGASFAPLSPEGDAFFAAFETLSTSELTSAYLGKSFSDVLIGPTEYGTGSTTSVKSKFPTGTNRQGLKVSTLTSAQRALVVAAIEQWVGDYDASISDALLADYTSDEAFADTLIAWGGNQTGGPDPDVNGSYLRIDGPRLWLELSCQGGVVIQGQSHYHTIFRDKQFDYAADF